ncbi:MAG: hypothetical protein E3J56_08135 [Candidatus Aminicenantes bacterium]|nr:MAG: hypothetical protein E3J56_08135 [Candidatus Aminicenantes bacterium]
MRKFFLAILLMLLSFANAHNQEHRMYRNSSFNFVVSYPASWKVQETRVGVMFIAPPIKDESSAFAENVDISFNELNGTPENMDKYLEKTVRDLRSYEDMKNLKVLERGKIKIGGKEAGFLRYSCTLWGGSSIFKQYAIIETSWLILLTYCGEGKDFYELLPQAEGIIKSFRLVK